MATNETRISLRHGSSVPQNNDLFENELGFDTTNKNFYIGIKNKDEDIIESVAISSVTERSDGTYILNMP